MAVAGASIGVELLPQFAKLKTFSHPLPETLELHEYSGPGIRPCGLGIGSHLWLER